MGADARGPVLNRMSSRLSYADTDPAGIVYYAAYYPWFERVYSEWSYVNDFNGDRMFARWGTRIITVGSTCRYHVPALLHDPITVNMRLGRLGNTSVTYAFDVEHAETGELFAEGTMTFCFVHRQELDHAERPRPVPAPDGLREVLRAAGYDV